MPMDFPDMKSLERAAEMWKFRKPGPDESEESYRNALANFVASQDIVESQEIRHKVGWDKWNDRQGEDLVIRGFMEAFEKQRRPSVCYCSGTSDMPCPMHPWIKVEDRHKREKL